MSGRIPIVMFGAAGRMGQMIVQLALGDENFEVVGAVEHENHPLIGLPMSHLVPGAPANLRLEAAPPASSPADAVAIHFSLPEGTLKHVHWAAGPGGKLHAAVIGTTGFSTEQAAEIKAASAHAPIILTPNTSTGVNLLFWLAREASRLSGEDFDIEITEMHHKHKKDAPSGTARRLAEVVLEPRGGDYDTDVQHGREGNIGARRKGEVGMHALRGGDVIGDHTVVFAGPGERLEITHRAHTRETFARGALRAAAWLHERQPGFYSMKDVLGL